MCKTMLSFIWSYRASKVKIVFGIQILQLIPAFSSKSRSDSVAGEGVKDSVDWSDFGGFCVGAGLVLF